MLASSIVRIVSVEMSTISTEKLLKLIAEARVLVIQNNIVVEGGETLYIR